MPTSLPDFKRVLPSDFDHCRMVIRRGSKSFYAASLLLPKTVRQAAYATYAFCRVADDAVDIGDDPQAINYLSERLDRVYSGDPIDQPVDRAFSFIVSAWNIPRALPDALLEGLKWDAEGRTYRTLVDLDAYAARVAASVGGLMTTIMDTTDRVASARACDLGTAMQLTNMARDIGEDARAGRVYIPLDWLEQEGLTKDSFIASPQFDERIGRITKRMLDAAEPLYQRGLSGVALLPKKCRTAIIAAGLIYREIGAEIAANGYDSVNQRAFVSKRTKLALVRKAMNYNVGRLSTEAGLPANEFLVSAMNARPENSPSAMLPNQLMWVLDLFNRMDSLPRRPNPDRGKM